MVCLLNKVKRNNVVSIALINKLNSQVMLLVLALGLTIGCAGTQSAEGHAVVENVNIPDGLVDGYRNLTPDQAYIFIKESGPLILDVRTLREYERSHLKLAVLFPLGKLATRIDELREIFVDSNIVVYCQSGNRSETAAELLVENGFSGIINMSGGLKAWIVRDYPVVISNNTTE